MLTTFSANSGLTSGAYILSYAERCGAGVDSRSQLAGDGWVAASLWRVLARSRTQCSFAYREAANVVQRCCPFTAALTVLNRMGKNPRGT